MKKIYNTPELEIIKLKTQQLICASISVLDEQVVDPLAPSFTDEELEGYFE